MKENFLLFFLVALPFTEAAVSLYHACLNTNECPTQATCSKKGYESCLKGRCMCPTGYAQVGTICKQYLGYDQDCSDSAKTLCKSPFSCQSNKCKCSSSLTEIDPSDNTKCIRKDRKNIDEACTSNTQCYYGNGGSKASCVNAKCSCNHYKADGNSKCIHRSYDEACTSSVGCITSVCSNQKCACGTGLKWDSSTSTCIKYQYNEDCSQGKICDSVKGLSCISNKCSCSSSKRWDSATNKCIYAKYGETCGTLACESGLTCKSSKCECATTGKKWDSSTSTCIYYKYGESCDSTKTCESGLVCLSSGTCGCSTTSKMTWDAKLNRCRFYLFGESCDANKKCNDGIGLNCNTGGTCDCTAARRIWDSSANNCRTARWQESCVAANCDTSLNLQCSSTTKKCECITNYNGYKSVYVSYWSGSSSSKPTSRTTTDVCIHKDSQLNLGKGTLCVYTGTVLKLCKKGYTCKINACPLVGSTFQNVCVDDPEGNSSNILKLNAFLIIGFSLCYSLLF